MKQIVYNIFICLIFLGACNKTVQENVDTVRYLPRAQENKVRSIRVIMILISFGEIFADLPKKRTQAEAEQLAKKIFEQIEKDPNPAVMFQLMRDHSDELHRQVFEIANYGSEESIGDHSRRDFPESVGNFLFDLPLLKPQYLPYDPKISPFGYVIAMRLPDAKY